MHNSVNDDDNERAARRKAGNRQRHPVRSKQRSINQKDTTTQKKNKIKKKTLTN